MAEGREKYRDKLKSRYKNAKRLSMAGTVVGGLPGKIIVFLVAFGAPAIFTLFVAAIAIVVLAGGMLAIFETDPKLTAGAPKTTETADPDTGSGGRDTTVPAAIKGKLLYPAGSVITSPQGNRNLGKYSYHDGLDLSGTYTGESVRYILPIYPGTVTTATTNGGDFGQLVVVKHDVEGETLYSLYAHMSKLLVKTGDKVGFKDNLGIMGTTGNSTGVHLHLEIHDKTFKYYNRATRLMVADYLTCSDKKGKIANAIQSISECRAYRDKVVGGK